MANRKNLKNPIEQKTTSKNYENKKEFHPPHPNPPRFILESAGYSHKNKFTLRRLYLYPES